MEAVTWLVDVVLHMDVHLAAWAQQLGPWLYVVLFAIIFCETGLVFMPLLPGDSLLFAAGALTVLEGSPLGAGRLIVVLSAAAILGDAVNYAVGYRLGEWLVHRAGTRLVNPRHLERTHAFYEKYGNRTIVLARFVPIVRTFAPFVAGIGKMGYAKFATYNIIGGIAWVASFVLAGHFFGDLPVVKRNFHLVILTIIVISLIPVVYELLRARAQSRRDNVLSRGD